jgi:hypothetical protein
MDPHHSKLEDRVSVLQLLPASGNECSAILNEYIEAPIKARCGHFDGRSAAPY